MTDTATSKRSIDWERIEPDWRAGLKTKLQLSAEYGVSRAALDKHFDKIGVGRDLTARIQQKAQELVTLDAVTQKVTMADRVTEKTIVDANATLQADVIRSHRSDICRGRRLVMSIMAELEELTDCQEEVRTLIDMIEQGDADTLATAARKVASLPQRIKGVKDLSDALKSLIGLERTAFGLADGEDGTDKRSNVPTVNVYVAQQLNG